MNTALPDQPGSLTICSRAGCAELLPDDYRMSASALLHCNGAPMRQVNEA
jgi:hypothetical protein